MLNNCTASTLIKYIAYDTMAETEQQAQVRCPMTKFVQALAMT